jgi:NADH-quinone oxidoreductase subunit M
MILHLPWLEIAIVIPLLGAFVVSRLRDPLQARQYCLYFAGLELVSTIATWLDFVWMDAHEAHDPWDLTQSLFGIEFLDIDELSAPLLPLGAGLFFLTMLTTLRTKVRRFSFSLALLSEALTLGLFSCKHDWGIVAILCLLTIPPYIELIARKRSTRVYIVYMSVFMGLLCLGCYLIHGQPVDSLTNWTVAPIMLAILIRSGMIPFHSWVRDLFANATFGTALLYLTPMTGAYAAIRLLLPVASQELLQSLGLLSLVTAVYTAGLALVQREGRQFFCCLLLSHSALVLMGLECVQPIGLIGALCMWFSVAVSLAGFGLTLRALEARRGQIWLYDYQGLYQHTPALAICFMLLGLASVGFPGTIGFIGTEMLVDGAVKAYPHVGVAVVLAAALNGIAVVQAYFMIFTGKTYSSTVSLAIGRREKFAVLSLAALVLIGGLLPQPGVLSRQRAADEILKTSRKQVKPVPEKPNSAKSE